MKKDFRSSCPIASALDIVGDKWTLLIIRDMLLQGKKTFKEFSISPEGIAPGILSARLKWLEENEMISKRKLPDNQKENIYLLTEKAIEIAPIITEIILWSDTYLRKDHASMYSIAELGFHEDKAKVIKGVQHRYRDMIQTLLN